MPIVGGLDIHRKQITFDCVDTETGELQRGRIAPADRAHLADWLARRVADRAEVHLAFEGCTGWRYVAEELARAGPRFSSTTSWSILRPLTSVICLMVTPSNSSPKEWPTEMSGSGRAISIDLLCGGYGGA